MPVRQHSLPFGALFVTRRPEPTSLDELLLRAQALAQRSIGELAAALGVVVPATPRQDKGFVGQLVEAALGADPQAGPRPDFPNLGVELKTIPITFAGVPLESTFCCSVAMQSTDSAEWENSRLRAKLQRVLWVPVLGARITPWAERHFGDPRLWEPSAAEWQALRADWEDLIGALADGQRVHAHSGAILQIRPKGRNGRVRVLAVANDGVAPALPVAFYLRPAFTAGVLAGPR